MKDYKYSLSLGGGVQSTAMALMIIDKIINIQLDIILFADTGGELPTTYQNIAKVKAYAESNNIEFCTVKRSDFYNDQFNDLKSAIFTPYINKNGTEAKSWFAIIPMKLYSNGKQNMLRHQCASNFKIRPMEKFLKNKFPDSKIVQYIGISTDEIRRMRYSNSKKFESQFPLIKYRKSRNDCLKYLLDRNWTVGKSRCFYCPHQKDSDWQEVKNNYPLLFEEAIKIDEYIREHKYIRNKKYKFSTAYLYKNTPLKDVNFGIKDDEDLFEYDCGGHCAL